VLVVLCRFVLSTDAKSMEGAADSLDLILNTVSGNHDLNDYLPLLVQSTTTYHFW
jgi:D-arabinose 1-dehydrogenase-like Zn-dependent alcohol dehydrogenase